MTCILILCRNFREVCELIGMRLLQIRPETVAGLWHVAILHLYRYCCLLEV